MATLPYSGTLTGPFSLNSIRAVSTAGTCSTMAAHRSGLRTSAPPAGMPPALTPSPASRPGRV